MTSDHSLASDTTRQNWLYTFGVVVLIVLLSMTLLWNLNRPMYGLHSWAQASGAWAARAHVHYGLGYTHGLSTWAVGNPPTDDPVRYMDHPQLSVLMHAASMMVFGVNDRALRLERLVATILSILLLMRLMRAMFDDRTALLAGLLFVLFPLTGYFGSGWWLTPAAFWAFWCYLICLGGLGRAPARSTRHVVGLAASLFIMVQLGWSGFFYAAGIGIHYVARCIVRRQWPQTALLVIMIVSPLLSLLVNFTVMAAGYGWDVDKIVGLFTWRATSGERQHYGLAQWTADMLRHGHTNFTWILLSVMAVGVGAAMIAAVRRWITHKPAAADALIPVSHLWLFFLPGILQVTILKGCLEQHQTWQHPFALFVAVAAALALRVMVIALYRINRPLSMAVLLILLGLTVYQSQRGLAYYRSIRYYSAQMIRMFQAIHDRIPADQRLLSFHHYKIQQHESKGTHYRPEVAWYLDREIDQAVTPQEINAEAATGQYPFYLIQIPPASHPYYKQIVSLIQFLQAHYPVERFEGDPDMAGDIRYSQPHLLFDLQHPLKGA